MYWGHMITVVCAVTLPAVIWIVLWRTAARRSTQAAIFMEDPAAVDHWRQPRVPLALAAGLSVASQTLHAAAPQSEGVKGTSLLGVFTPMGFGIGFIVLPLLALITVTTGKPRWLPRVTGEAPTPPPISAKGDRQGIVMTWLFTPLMTFIALGIGSGIRSPWAGLAVLFAWPFAAFGARMLRQRLEVSTEGILITSLWFDYVWRFEDIELVSIDHLNCLCLRDRAGRNALAFTCPFPQVRTQEVVHQLEAMGYSVAALEPHARWRPNAPGVLRRRVAQFDGGQILVTLIYAALGLALSTAGATP